jgi:hypothetical protein
VIEDARAVEAEDDGYRAEIRQEQMPRSSESGAG